MLSIRDGRGAWFARFKRLPSHRQAADLGGSVSAPRLCTAAGPGLPVNLIYFASGRLALLLQDASWWLV
jgi:hypothetical protein